MGSTDFYLERCDTAKLRTFIGKLAMIDVEEDDWREQVTLALVDEFKITLTEFRFLDEKPGWFGYQVDENGNWAKEGMEWHWKLRRVRNNPDNGLFDILSKAA